MPDRDTEEGAVVPAHTVGSIEVPTAAEYIPRTRRAMTELPAKEEQFQAVICAVLMLSLIGVSDTDISYALEIPHERITAIKAHEAYQETFELLFSELIRANADAIRSRIASFSGRAVENMMTLADAEISKELPAIVKFRANQDILDRAGLGADALSSLGDGENAEDAFRIVVETDHEGAAEKTTVDFSRKRNR